MSTAPRLYGDGYLYKPINSRFYHLKFYPVPGGKPEYRSTKKETLEEAEKERRKIMRQKEDHTLLDKKTDRLTLRDLYQYKLADLEKHHKDTKWVKPCWARLDEYMGSRKANTLRLADLSSYQTYRMGKYRVQFKDADAEKLQACEGQVNKDMRLLKSILYHAQEIEKLKIVPSFPKDLMGPKEREGTISEYQYQTIRGLCRDNELWLKTMLTMGWMWGYRAKELCRMRVVQVNLEDRYVILPPRTTKNKQARTIPISDEELPMLAECIRDKQPEDFVFTRSNGKPVLDFRDRWDSLVKISGAGHFEIDGETGKKRWVPAIFHDLRRSAITTMLQGGMASENVRKVVGHLSKEMTDRYNKPATDSLRESRRLAAERSRKLLPPDGIGSSLVKVAEISGD